MRARAAIMRSYNKPLEIGEIEVPEPTGEAVVVKVAGAGICHSDLHLLRGEIQGMPSPLPIVLGHENSGYVYAVGEKAPRELVGRPVLVFGAWYEEEDEFTLAGEQQLAYRATWPGILKYNGGYAEYMYVPSYKFLVSAEGLDDLEAAAVLTDAGLTPYRAVRRLVGLVSPDDYVVVVGLGGLGLFGLQFVKLLLRARAIAIDVSDEKLEMARKFAKLEAQDHLINASKADPVEEVKRIAGARGARAVVDFVGSQKTIDAYLKVLGRKGTYVIVGLHSPLGPHIPIHAMVINEVSIVGSLWGNIRELREVVELARRGLIKYKELVTKVGLEEVNEAFERLEKGLVSGRQVLVPSGK
ncbi:MAG: zinc-binding dehydrogenase [Desulfurococcaceae archaeon]